MRINHNVSAMNALRLLNVNNSASAKTLEKLSSGKRINRAGDDAAGMAISEKMQAQVNGLKIASRNSLDGVSLVQTAEGAMAEIHSMLQRMRELAVQSANGTMSKDDRQAIQDEVNQLTSEVNRISNGTEYNTRHILKGNEEPKSNSVVQRMTTGDVAKTTFDNLNINAPSEVLITNIKNKTLSIDVNGKKTEVNLQGFGSDNTTLTGEEFLIRINDALGDDAVAVFNSSNKIEVRTKDPGGSQSIKLEGSAIPDLFTTGKFDPANNNRVTVSGVAENSGGTAHGAFYLEKSPDEGSFIVVGNDRIDFYDSSKSPYVGSNKAIDVSAGTPKGAIGPVIQTQVYDAAAATPTPGKFEFNITAPLQAGDRILINDVEFKGVLTAATPPNNNEFVIGATSGATISNLATKVAAHPNLSSVYTAVAALPAAAPTKIAFDTSSPTKLTANISKTKSPEDIVAEIKNNVQLDTVSFSINSNNKKELLLTAKEVGFKGNLISLEGTLDGFNTNLQIGANSGQNFRLEVGDIRARALRISADKPTGNPGVTGASYVKMPNVTDGVSSSTVEYSLDVSDEKLASAAIEVYNNAIIRVASERSKLGATQNRLEHTIANLDNSGENLTSAMSRIQDTDMAEEMANFQRLNVLQQAGTSMLAQANQQPQSILKLLQ